MREFSVRLIGLDCDPVDDNVDVEVDLDDGFTYVATFFTLENLRSLFARNRETGECASGLYFWASHMILVERLDQQVIAETVASLLEEGEFFGVFDRI